MAQTHEESTGDTHTLVTHYAVLIGINTYQKKPLQGCVRDVQNIEAYINNGCRKPFIVKTLVAGDNVSSETASPSE